MEKRIKITNCKQFETLVAELEKNPSLAKGFSRGTVPMNFQSMWDEISTKINALGPPIRDSDGWQKVWRDLKFKTKKKIAHNKAESNATGGGRNKMLHISALEEAVTNLMQFEKQLNPEGSVFGVEKDCEPVPTFVPETQENALQPTLQISVEESSFSPHVKIKSAAPVKKSSKCAEKIGRNTLLESHTEMQEKVLGEMAQAMVSIKNNLKDFNRYERKSLEIQERKLALLKRKNEREEELFQNDLELKKIKLQIKKAELKMLNERTNS